MARRLQNRGPRASIFSLDAGKNGGGEAAVRNEIGIERGNAHVGLEERHLGIVEDDAEEWPVRPFTFLIGFLPAWLQPNVPSVKSC